ncbi:MAG: hypothetical protein LC637_12965 [Xanthomonadaceae bacterium]|nr:hypothetical protein [Xanthomonadaceae bacterium]
MFPLLDGDYQEFGYTRIKLGGFGLQNYLIAIRHVHSRVLDGPNAILFATVQSGAGRSRDNLLLQGFERWSSPDSKLVHHKAEMARAKGKAPTKAEYLKLSVDKLRKHAEFVLDKAALHTIRRVNLYDGSRELSGFA